MTSTNTTATAVKTVAVNPHGGALAVRKGNVGGGNGFAVAYAVADGYHTSTMQRDGGVAIMFATRKAADKFADGLRTAGNNGAHHPIKPGSVTVLPTAVVASDVATGRGSDLHAVATWLYAAWLDVADGHAAARDAAAADAAAADAAAAKRAAAAAKRKARAAAAAK